MIFILTAADAKLLQSCPTLCDPIDGSPPGSLVPGILQARTLEWVAISFSNSWKWKVKVKSFIHVWFLATPWTATYQAPPSMKFSRQEYWSGVPLPSPIHFDWCEVISHCRFELAMLNILSCHSWPSECCLRRNVHLGLLPIFWLDFLFWCSWASWVVCKFWRLIPYLSHCLQIFSSIL